MLAFAPSEVDHEAEMRARRAGPQLEDLRCPVPGCVPPERDLRHPKNLAQHLLREHAIKPPAPPAIDAPGEFYCRLPDCPFPGPFESHAGLAGHKKRTHGQAGRSVNRRPPGTIPCPENCGARPYATKGGLATHLRSEHGYVSKGVRREAERAAKTARFDPNAPLPPPIGADPYQPTHGRPIDPGVREKLRRRLLWSIGRAWAAEWDADPTLLRNALAELLASNFAPPRAVAPVPSNALFASPIRAVAATVRHGRRAPN